MRIALLLFLLACIFDPADKALGLKAYLFAFAWFISAIHFLWEGRLPRVHAGLVLYTALFIFVPVLSIVWYLSVDGAEPYEGLPLLKGYLLLTFAPLLFIERINLMPLLSGVLTSLAVAIIVVFAMVMTVPDLYSGFYLFGAVTGIVVLDNRDYGSGLVLTQIYFVTSPMLAIAIAYYFDRWHATPSQRARLGYLLLIALNVAGMVLAGTRNNLAVAVLLPLTLLFLNARDRLTTRVLAIIIGAAVIVAFFNQLMVLLDPNEYSNSLKLAMLDDYGAILDDARTLFFGQGLGAYETWPSRSYIYFYGSELTYIELIRNFGIFGAVVLILLLCFPVAYVFLVDRSHRNVVVGYAFYLLMCASNPNLFSSMGMLILAVVLANLFIVESTRARRLSTKQA